MLEYPWIQVDSKELLAQYTLIIQQGEWNNLKHKGPLSLTWNNFNTNIEN